MHKKHFGNQQQYLRSTSNEKLAELVYPLVGKKGIITTTEVLSKVCGLMKERATFVKDILDEGMYFFESPTEYDAKTVKKKWKEHTPEILAGLKADFNTITEFTHDNIEATFSSFLAKKEIGFGQIGPALRLAVSGKGMGPSLFDICEILGKEESLNRIDIALNKIKK